MKKEYDFSKMKEVKSPFKGKKSLFARFQPDIKGKPLDGVVYRLVFESDANEIAKITFEREGLSKNKDFGFYLERTKKELEDIESAIEFNLIVAEYKKEIVGFGRSIYYDLRKTQVPYFSPSGWYLMGLVVKPNFRRRGIGRRITEERMALISENSNEVYFVINSINRVSIELHKKLGFKKIDEGKGFLKIKFDGRKGYLFKKEI